MCFFLLTICGGVWVLVDDMRQYLLCRRSPVPEEVTGAELICFNLILPDSGEMRLYISVCVFVCPCLRVCLATVIVDLGSSAMERGFPGQAIRVWQWLTRAPLLKRSNQYTCQVKCYGAAYLPRTHPFHTYTHIRSNTRAIFASLLPPSLLMKSPCSHYLKEKAAYTQTPAPHSGEV